MDKEAQNIRIQEICQELADLMGGNGRVTILVRHPTDDAKGCLVSEETDLSQIVPAVKRFLSRTTM